MIKVLFVGEAETVKGTSSQDAFIGTRAHKRLQTWQQYLLVGPAQVSYVNSMSKADTATIAAFDGIIIALGYDAGLRVKKLDKVCYHLPSVSSHETKDAAYEMEQLRRCKQWIYTNIAKGA